MLSLLRFPGEVAFYLSHICIGETLEQTGGATSGGVPGAGERPDSFFVRSRGVRDTD